MKTRFLAAILLPLFVFNSHANEESDIDMLVKPILEAIQSGETKNIASLAFPVGSQNRNYISNADIKQLDSHFETSFNTVGKSYGYHLHHQANIPDIYVLRYYVFKFERQPGLIKIEAYKPKDTWRIYSIEIDDKLDDYIERSAVYHLGSMSDKSFRKKLKETNKD